MDFQAFVDCCAMPCAVLSVELTEDKRCGDIRIVCGNRAYREQMGPAFHDNMLYHELVPREPKFEDFCFRSAIMGQKLHAYVETELLDCWSDQTLIPMEHDDDNIGYCQFLIESTSAPDPERMAGVSMDTATSAIKASITLMGAEDIRTRVIRVLDDILEQTEGFSGRVVLVDAERKAAYTFCESFCKGFFPDIELSDATIPYTTVESWARLFESTNIVIIKDEQDMADVERVNPTWVGELKMYNISSIIMIPLRQGSQIIGYLYISNFNVGKVIESKELVELMAYFLGSEISNYLLMQQLEEMSNRDGLTGMFNRRAMLKRMKDFDEQVEPVPFGVINLDLNGLKAVNDSNGHDEGDKLLIEASEILKKVFHEEDLFRTGGDEFIVISTNIEKDVFDRKVKRLRSDVKKSKSVNLAIGTYWSDGSDDMRTAFVSADEMMYADKKAFYASHPDLLRRY